MKQPQKGTVTHAFCEAFLRCRHQKNLRFSLLVCGVTVLIFLPFLFIAYTVESPVMTAIFATLGGILLLLFLCVAIAEARLAKRIQNGDYRFEKKVLIKKETVTKYEHRHGNLIPCAYDVTTFTFADGRTCKLEQHFPYEAPVDNSLYTTVKNAENIPLHATTFKELEADEWAYLLVTETRGKVRVHDIFSEKYYTLADTDFMQNGTEYIPKI